MKCPHCLVEYHSHPHELLIGTDQSETGWVLHRDLCPSCGKFILKILAGEAAVELAGNRFVGIVGPPKREFLAYPRSTSRTPCPAEVPAPLADDYREACLVLSDSPKASAALSRRCLQVLLRQVAGVKPGNLAAEIQQVLDSGKLPSWLAGSIDAIRNVGNFAAHPMKGQTSGEILPVEPGEAEWNLDVLESLFDFYYVQPAINERRKESLNLKLKEAGKLPMK